MNPAISVVLLTTFTVTNTNDAVLELTRYLRMDPNADARVRKHIERSAAVVLERLVNGEELLPLSDLLRKSIAVCRYIRRLPLPSAG